MGNILSIHKVTSREEAEQIIKELVEKGEVAWSRHCKDRMIERDISIPQIINCLLKGKVTEDPFPSLNGSGYETRVEKVTAGEWLRVAVCLKFSQRLLVITVIK